MSYQYEIYPLSLEAKRNCIVYRSLKILKLIIKHAVRLILDNVGIVGSLPVDSSHFSLHLDSILSSKVPEYFILNALRAV